MVMSRSEAKDEVNKEGKESTRLAFLRLVQLKIESTKVQRAKYFFFIPSFVSLSYE